METELYDVLAVNMKTHKVRIIGEKKTLPNANAIEIMAVARRGVNEEFFTTVSHSSFEVGTQTYSTIFSVRTRKHFRKSNQNGRR